MTFIETFYNKYNEDGRLRTPYGRVEYETTMHYIRQTIERIRAEKDAPGSPLRVLDIGCAAGVYAIPLMEDGHDVTCVDPVNYHLGRLKQKAARKGLKARTLKGQVPGLKLKDGESFDLVLMLGPLYHLFTEEDKTAALREGAGFLNGHGRLLAGYIMNEFAVLTYGMLDGHFLLSLRDGKLDRTFHVRNTEEDMFSFDRTEDIFRYTEQAGLTAETVFSQDGPTNYFRQAVAALDEMTFRVYLDYHLAVCERPDLIGAGCHTCTVLKKRPGPG